MAILADPSPLGIVSLGQSTFGMETLDCPAAACSNAAPEICDRNSGWAAAIIIHPIFIVNKNAYVWFLTRLFSRLVGLKLSMLGLQGFLIFSLSIALRIQTE
jgi:hypothetical protein